MKWRGHEKRPLPPASRCTAQWAAWPCRPPSGRRWSHHSPPPETHSISSQTRCNTSHLKASVHTDMLQHITPSVHTDMLQHITPHSISSHWHAATHHTSQHQFMLTCCNTPHLTASVHPDILQQSTTHSISSHWHAATSHLSVSSHWQHSTPQCQFTLTTLHTSQHQFTLTTHLTASVHTDNTPHSISSHWQHTSQHQFTLTYCNTQPLTADCCYGVTTKCLIYIINEHRTNHNNNNEEL